MSAPPLHAWLNALLAVLRDGQDALLWAMHALGLTGELHGTPSWPLPWRIAGENLVVDQGLARQFAWMLGALLLTAACVLLALWWRRAWHWFAGVAVLGLVAAPWPAAGLWLAPAVPTSFARPAEAFSVASIARGRDVYTAQCASCHGADGRGEGPQAASLRLWPPTMASGLLARRADGELFWNVLYGMRDAQGITMPGFVGRIGDRDIWAALDYMRVLSASAGMTVGGSWPVPIALPDVAVRCGAPASATDSATREASTGRATAGARSLSDWRGTQRVRVFAVDATHPPPDEDPRFLTLLVTRDGRAPVAPAARRNVIAAVADCYTASPDAWRVYADIAGAAPDRLAGTQWLADRDGWLRAQAPAGDRGWADGGLLCTAAPVEPTPGSKSALPADALTAVLKRMDGDPVRYVKGGFVH